MNDENNFHVNNTYGISSRRVKSVNEIVSVMLLAATAMFAPKMSLASCYGIDYSTPFNVQAALAYYPGTTILIRPSYGSSSTYPNNLTLTTSGGAAYSMSWGCTDGKLVYLSPFFYTTRYYQEARILTGVLTWSGTGAFIVSSTSHTPKNFGTTPMECSVNTCAGNPINTATGNKYQVETDFVGASDAQIELRRTYNSLDSRVAFLGVSWRHTYERSVFSGAGSGLAQLYRPDGRVEDFWLQSGVWVADPDVTNTLAPVIIGGMQTGWKVTTSDDSTEYYNMAGQLTSMVTRSGLTTTLAYNANNQLMTVTGPFGHVLSFAYNANGNVSQMTAPDGGVYAYAYNATNSLASVTYPDMKVRQYVYENTSYPNALTGIIDESGNRYGLQQQLNQSMTPVVIPSIKFSTGGQ